MLAFLNNYIYVVFLDNSMYLLFLENAMYIVFLDIKRCVIFLDENNSVEKSPIFQPLISPGLSSRPVAPLPLLTVSRGNFSRISPLFHFVTRSLRHHVTRSPSLNPSSFLPVPSFTLQHRLLELAMEEAGQAGIEVRTERMVIG